MTKIHVENFGRVRSAELNTAPLMLLVGKNNTGKSYVATLLWALSNLYQAVSSAEIKRPTWWQKFVRSANSDKAASIEIGLDRQAELLGWLNKALEEKGSDVLSNAFAYPGFQNTKVSLVVDQERPKFGAAITTAETGDNEKKIAYFNGTLTDDRGEALYRFRMPMLRQSNLVRMSDRIFLKRSADLLSDRNGAELGIAFLYPRLALV